MYNYEWDRLKTWLDQYGAIDDKVVSPDEVIRLDLSGHKLKEIHESIGILEKLLVLNLSHNRLTKLPESMKELSNLSNLDLRRNNFEELPPYLKELPLRSLNASANKLEDITILGQCKSLRVLDLNTNLIKEVDTVFSTDNDLLTLNLANNYIKDVSGLFLSLEKLQRLNLSDNLISSLPDTSGSLSSLEELEMTDNALESIDDSFFDLELEKINFTANELRNLHLHGLESLESLTLDENPLKTLTLSNDFAPYLIELSCDSCRLKSFVLPSSKLLESLYYSSNEISEVPSSIQQYEKLTKLDLEGNDIVELPDALANLSTLNTLYIMDNPLSDYAKKVVSILDPEICDLNMKSGITIEMPKQDDLEEMAYLLQILFEIETDFTFDFPTQLSGITKLYEHESSDLLVAKYEDEVIGMVTMQRLISSAEGNYIGQIEDLVVKENFRKMGVGSRLVNKIRTIAQDKEYKRIQLAADMSNENALQFYSRRGFMKTHLNIYHYANVAL